MKSITIIVQITVDEENIKDLYPNYAINWETVDEFVDSFIPHIESEVEIDGLPIDHLKKYGYKIEVLTRDEAKVLDLDLDQD